MARKLNIWFIAGIITALAAILSLVIFLVSKDRKKKGGDGGGDRKKKGGDGGGDGGGEPQEYRIYARAKGDPEKLFPVTMCQAITGDDSSNQLGGCQINGGHEVSGSLVFSKFGDDTFTVQWKNRGDNKITNLKIMGSGENKFLKVNPGGKIPLSCTVVFKDKSTMEIMIPDPPSKNCCYLNAYVEQNILRARLLPSKDYADIKYKKI